MTQHPSKSNKKKQPGQAPYPMTGGVVLNTLRSCLEQPIHHFNTHPDKLIFALQQNYCQYQAVVKSGDQVQPNQVIGKAYTPHQTALDQETGQMLHTGLAGQVQILDNTIIIHTSVQQPPPPPLCPVHVSTPTQLQHLLHRSGILGLGGAMFPTADKLLNTINQPTTMPHTLVINGVECEPMLGADAYLMRYETDTILAGIDRIMSCLHMNNAIFAIEDDKPLAIETIRQATAHRPQIRVQALQTIYPAGGSRQLYEQLFGHRLAANEHSLQQGVLTLNVHTIKAIHDATLGQPLTHRIVTLAGLVQANNSRIAIGTPIAWIQAQLQLLNTSQSTPMSIRLGGPVMGQKVKDRKTSAIQAGTTAVIFTQETTPAQRPCIQCGDCNTVCPEALQPQTLLHYASAQQQDRHNPQAAQALEQLSLESCIVCSACDLVCPSHIPLAQLFAEEQVFLKQTQDKKRAATRARQHYEAKQARLAKPPRANPSKARSNIQPTQAKPCAQSKLTLQAKTQLAKAQRLYREACAAFEQAKKKQLDSAQVERYQQRIESLHIKVQHAQLAFNQAQQSDAN